jgi:hypothetical protein
MKSAQFIQQLCALRFTNTFNPYSDRCAIHDRVDAPRRRAAALLALLNAATNVDLDAIWIGRDLGYRGGRRTGLALTDDVHVCAHVARWGVDMERPTKGSVVAERTAAVIWSMLSRIQAPIFLWNVFPLHPHEPEDQFTNRAHNARERETGEEILLQLVSLLKPRRLVAIGNNAAQTAQRVTPHIEVHQVRHPSYGGQTDYMRQISALYDLSPDRQRRLL